jgi:hypothetical protein
MRGKVDGNGNDEDDVIRVPSTSARLPLSRGIPSLIPTEPFTCNDDDDDDDVVDDGGVLVTPRVVKALARSELCSNTNTTANSRNWIVIIMVVSFVVVVKGEVIIRD